MQVIVDFLDADDISGHILSHFSVILAVDVSRQRDNSILNFDLNTGGVDCFLIRQEAVDFFFNSLVWAVVYIRTAAMVGVRFLFCPGHISLLINDGVIKELQVGRIGRTVIHIPLPDNGMMLVCPFVLMFLSFIRQGILLSTACRAAIHILTIRVYIEDDKSELP